MSIVVESNPHKHQWAIGRHPGDSGDLIGILRRTEGPLVDTLFGLIENHGDVAFTVSAYGGDVQRGSVAFSGQPDDADTLIIDDGINPAVTFEFDSDDDVTPTATLRQVVIGTNIAATLGALIAAIAAAPTLDIVGTLDAEHLVRLVGSHPDATNTALAGTDVAGVQTQTGLSGGTGAVHNLRINGADVANVAVTPHGRVIFALEWAAADVKDHLSFYATGGDDVLGELSLCYWNGDLTRLESWQA